MKFLVTACALLFAGCFRTEIPQPDGSEAVVKTPCDGDIWAVTKRYGKPDQVVLRDHEYYQIRYWYQKSHTAYGFGWYDNINGNDCHVGKQILLASDGIR